MGDPPDLTEVMGCDADEYSDRLYHHRPPWVQGIVSHFDARYLFSRALASAADTLVEIGTASGVSTAFLCSALDVASRAGRIGTDYRVWSYDLSSTFYADSSRLVGDATRQMLSPSLIGHIGFRNPATALSVADEFGSDSVSFLFVDANHRHPWPALDLLATLDCLHPGAEAVLHDINLPVREPDSRDRGVKYLFDDLDAEKLADTADPTPNIGSVWIPADKAGFREQLLAIVSNHEWEAEPWDAVTSRLLADA